MVSKPLGPYTPILRAGDWLIVSGQIGLKDGQIISGGLTAEVSQALANLADLLAGEGASITDVVKTTVYLHHIDDYAEMNDIYVEFFGGHRPARAAVAVAGLPLHALVEIEAWAYTG